MIGAITVLRPSSYLLLVLVSIQANSQASFEKSYQFLNHLSEIESYEEGVYFIEKNIGSYQYPSQLDTLNYIKGVFQYQLRLSDESIQTFSKLGNSNQRFKTHATFLNAFQRAYLGDLQDAHTLLDTLAFDDGVAEELRVHELAGLSLLQRDLPTFETYSSQFTGQYFQLTPFQDQLILNKDGLLLARKKSSFLAGVLSGVIPGTGKFYTGKVGEGYMTLLLSTILGLQVREAYKKDGADSFRFKLFAGLFSTLYIANIWGSVLSVKIYKDDFNETFDDAILLNMHVPIRTIFD